MICPFCKSKNTRVVDTRNSDKDRIVRRRRECLNCKKRFTTYERYEPNPTLVIKKDNKREVFDPNKIMNSIIKACDKRLLACQDIKSLVNDIEIEINHLNLEEIPSRKIGEIVMEKLKQVDKVAYVRFASVYEEFDDLSKYEELLGHVSKENK